MNEAEGYSKAVGALSLAEEANVFCYQDTFMFAVECSSIFSLTCYTHSELLLHN